MSRNTRGADRATRTRPPNTPSAILAREFDAMSEEERAVAMSPRAARPSAEASAFDAPHAEAPQPTAPTTSRLGTVVAALAGAAVTGGILYAAYRFGWLKPKR